MFPTPQYLEKLKAKIASSPQNDYFGRIQARLRGEVPETTQAPPEDPLRAHIASLAEDKDPKQVKEAMGMMVDDVFTSFQKNLGQIDVGQMGYKPAEIPESRKQAAGQIVEGIKRGGTLPFDAISKAAGGLVTGNLTPKEGETLGQYWDRNPYLGDVVSEKTRELLKDTPLSKIPGAMQFLPAALGFAAEVGLPGPGGEAKAAKGLKLKKIGVKAEKNLATDPKNFETFEEYVKAQGTPVYHQSTEKGMPKFDAFFGTEEFNKAFPKEFGENLTEAVLPKNAKVLDLDLGSKEAREFMAEASRKAYPDDVAFQKDLLSKPFIPSKYNEVAKKGLSEDFYQDIWTEKIHASEVLNDPRFAKYDAVKFQEEILIPKRSIPILKTKSQLTDIWEKANKAVDTTDPKNFNTAEEFMKGQGEVKIPVKTNPLAAEGLKGKVGFRETNRGIK